MPRNDIYNQESNKLPRRRTSSSSVSGKPRNGSAKDAGERGGLYGNRERRNTLHDDLRGSRGAPSQASPAARPASSRRRRRASRMQGANKWVLIFLLAVLLGYMAVLGVSLYRTYLQEEAMAPPPPVPEAPQEEAPAVVEDPDDPALNAARDAERTGAHLATWKGALNALYAASTDLERGESERGLERLEGAVEASPHIVELQLKLADLYMAQKRFAEARDLYVRVLETDPLREGVRLKWAQSLQALRHHEAALQVALWILEDDSFLEEPNQIAATAYLAMERIEEAVPHLRRQISVNRENVVAQNNLAVAYSRLGEYARAVTLFLDVLEADPRNAITYYNLAVSYAQQGDAGRAVETLETAADRFGFPFVSAWFKSRDFDPIRTTDRFQRLELMDRLPGDGNGARL